MMAVARVESMINCRGLRDLLDLGCPPKGLSEKGTKEIETREEKEREKQWREVTRECRSENGGAGIRLNNTGGSTRPPR